MKFLKENTKPSEVFVATPAIMLSVAYMVIQFIICIVTAIVNDGISLKLSLIINIILMALMWVLILAAINTRNHANRIDSRQEDHHVEL